MHTAFNLAVVQSACQQPGVFAVGTDCNSSDVGKHAASFNMRNSLCLYVPAFLLSVHYGKLADKSGRRLLLAMPVIGHMIFAIGFIVVQWTGGGYNWWLMVSALSSFFGSTPVTQRLRHTHDTA